MGGWDHMMQIIGWENGPHKHKRAPKSIDTWSSKEIGARPSKKRGLIESWVATTKLQCHLGPIASTSTPNGESSGSSTLEQAKNLTQLSPKKHESLNHVGHKKTQKTNHVSTTHPPGHMQRRTQHSMGEESSSHWVSSSWKRWHQTHTSRKKRRDWPTNDKGPSHWSP